jgi:hypothetical protein
LEQQQQDGKENKKKEKKDKKAAGLTLGKGTGVVRSHLEKAVAEAAAAAGTAAGAAGTLQVRTLLCGKDEAR